MCLYCVGHGGWSGRVAGAFGERVARLHGAVLFCENRADTVDAEWQGGPEGVTGAPGLVRQHHRICGARDEVERRLVEVWEEVLEVERIGVDDNFFDLGGDSITMVRIVAKVAERLGVRVSYRDFLVASTIGELAERIGRGEAGVEATVYPKVEPDVERIGEPFPLTEVQMAYLLGRESVFEMGGVSTHGYYEIETQVDLARLNRSLQQVIEHQPMLRAVVLRTGEQRILEEVGGYRIEEEDLRGLGGQERTRCG